MESDTNHEFDGPSKSQRKRDAHQLQALGLKLTTCSNSILRSLQLPDKTLAALTEYNRLPNSHGARRRQLQFIGKLMRDCDYEELSSALERLEKNETHKPKPTARSEIWAQRILANGDAEINTLVREHDILERQKLRQFHRDYHSSGAETQQRIQAKLQHYLHQILD